MAPYDSCALGTDCADCGARCRPPPSPPKPPRPSPPPPSPPPPIPPPSPPPSPPPGAGGLEIWPWVLALWLLGVSAVCFRYRLRFDAFVNSIFRHRARVAPGALYGAGEDEDDDFDRTVATSAFSSAVATVTASFEPSANAATALAAPFSTTSIATAVGTTALSAAFAPAEVVWAERKVAGDFSELDNAVPCSPLQ